MPVLSLVEHCRLNNDQNLLNYRGNKERIRTASLSDDTINDELPSPDLSSSQRRFRFLTNSLFNNGISLTKACLLH